MRVRYLLVAVGLAACSTDEGPGNGTMTALINGVEWRASKVTGMRTETTISVGGQSTPYPVVGLDATGVVGPGMYLVTDDIFAASAAGFSVLDSHGIGLTAAAGGAGALMITSWSDAQATGSFSFTTGQGTRVHYVSGTFAVTF